MLFILYSIVIYAFKGIYDDGFTNLPKSTKHQINQQMDTYRKVIRDANDNFFFASDIARKMFESFGC